MTIAFEMEARTVTASVGVILLTLVGTGTSHHCFNSEGKYDLRIGGGMCIVTKLAL